MSLRWLVALACVGSLVLAPTVGRADIASPGQRIVPSEVVLTGLGDFPAYRFVVALIPLPADAELPTTPPLPKPVAVREGEPVAASTTYFQHVRAVPVGAPEPVTDAWLASSDAPSSPMVTLRPLRVPIASTERVTRTSYHVRQIRAGWISLELMAAVAVMADGSERERRRPIPQSFQIEAFSAPPGWQLYLMADPSWPRGDPQPPVVPCSAGDVLPLSPGPRTLVAVQGTPNPDGSVAGQPFASLSQPLDPWRRDHVSPSSTVVSSRRLLSLQVEPGQRLQATTMTLYEDAHGEWFHDPEATLPVDPSALRWWWWAIASGAAVGLGLSGWLLWRRRRSRS